MSYQVQKRMPGRSVYRLAGELSDNDLIALTRDAGALLAALHCVRPPGAGPIDPEGHVEATSPPPGEPMVSAMIERNRDLHREGLDAGALGAAVAAVAANTKLLDETPVSLVHGDWRTTNVLSDGTSITGVVDWEGARGGDPAFDFAGVWTLRSRSKPTSTDLLLDSYRHAGGPTDDRFDVRRLLYRITDLHAALGHFLVTQRPDLLDLALTDLHSTLEQFHTIT